MTAFDSSFAELDTERHRVENDYAGRNVNFNVTYHAFPRVFLGAGKAPAFSYSSGWRFNQTANAFISSENGPPSGSTIGTARIIIETG